MILHIFNTNKIYLTIVFILPFLHIQEIFILFKKFIIQKFLVFFMIFVFKAFAQS